MPPPAGGEGMTGNRVPRFRHTVHIGRWRTRPPTNTLPGVHIMRHSEPASWPSPLRGSTFRSSLDPDPSLAFVCTEPGTRADQSQTPWPRGVDRPRSFRDDRPHREHHSTCRLRPAQAARQTAYRQTPADPAATSYRSTPPDPSPPCSASATTSSPQSCQEYAARGWVANTRSGPPLTETTSRSASRRRPSSTTSDSPPRHSRHDNVLSIGEAQRLGWVGILCKETTGGISPQGRISG